MRSAQRRNRLEKKTRRNNLLVAVKFLIIPLVLLLLFILVKLSTKYWNGNDKFIYTYRLESGDVAVTIADPKLSEETTLVIPGDTQTDVAGNYGTLRIKNVWKLSMNEKLGGSLLPRTITKDFLFPVFLWSDSDAQNLKKANVLGILKFILTPVKTNIPLGDRVSLGLFAFQVRSIDRTEIDLGQSKFLQKTTLKDGQTGYTLNGVISQRLTIYFSDNDFSGENVKVGIVDATGSSGVADNVGQIIQVLGGKVVSIDKKPAPSDSDCTVLGKNPKIVAKIAMLFDCRRSGGESTFDIELDLGSKFAKRF